ncbi:hypothetical protein [Staphylococcus hominis]|uniref:hypothetical protein n=1 Tax=Staphylococcus hominis TaxID=1290 RepID=UPI003BF9106B
MLEKVNELERSRQAAGLARLADEKVRRDREKRARAKHYIERINNDNLKQDFQTAMKQYNQVIQRLTKALQRFFYRCPSHNNFFSAQSVR